MMSVGNTNSKWHQEGEGTLILGSPLPQHRTIDGDRIADRRCRPPKTAIALAFWRWRPIIQLVLTLLTPWAVWRALTIVTQSSTPILVVTSGQYPFGFQRGDIILLRSINFNQNNYDDDKTPLFRPGELVSFRANDWISVPHVHRIMEVREERHDGASRQQKHKGIKILTKGDDNGADDRGLYNPGQLWLTPNDILGKVWGYVPYLGIPTILLQDYDVLGCLEFLLYARIVYQILFSNRSPGWIEWTLFTFFFLGQHVCYT